MKHEIKVYVGEREYVTIKVANNARLIEAIRNGVKAVIDMLKKTITAQADTYCWTRASYFVGGQELAVISHR